MIPADDGLRTALDRLSATLDRIHGLLTELYSVQQQRDPGESPGHDHAPVSAAPVTAGSTQPQGAGAACCGDTRAVSGGASVVYGGGPSAFAAR
jgi:hypothetical protein